MTSFTPSSKRPRLFSKEDNIQTENGKSLDGAKHEYFPGVAKIQFNPKAALHDPLVFRHYNATEVVMGRTMEDWLRFSVAYWHSFRGIGGDPFGAGTILRPWETSDDGGVQAAKNRVEAAFEFFSKLGVKYYTFHDRDMAPPGATLKETNEILDEVSDFALRLQESHGIKLLWATSNLFAHPRFANGAATNPDANVFAHAAAQVKKCLDVAKKLGAENFVFWGGREGFCSLLNTCLKTEHDNMANFFRMALEYKKKIGFEGQFLLEPKPKEPTRHQYDYDAMTVIAFLKTYNLDKDFKLNIEPNHTMLAGHAYEHDVAMASTFGFLGSVDCNTGSPDLGWDTDQFPTDVKNATIVMRYILAQKGLAPGGLNFDAKVRRESTDLRDLFIAHVGAMDVFARGLKAAARIEADGVLTEMVASRYASYASGVGARIRAGEATFEELEAHALGDEPKQTSGQQELYEMVLNQYV